MSWIDLGSPVPKNERVQYTPVIWPTETIKQLFVPNEVTTSPFQDIVTSRRTRRSFGGVSDDILSRFLWFSAHCQEEGSAELGFPLERQPAASAGAIHPIHILALSFDNHILWRYIPAGHKLAIVHISKDMLDNLRILVTDVVQPNSGTLLIFVAEPGKTFAKYKNGCSLIWRDAGVLQGHMSLVAEALSLNFCLLGITGDPWVKQLDEKGRLVGVGMALLGSRT